MKKILFSLFVFVFSNTILAQSSLPDAEYLLLRRIYTTNDDGSMDIRFRKEIKLLRNRAVTAYALNGETFIEYNPQSELLTINECYTLTPDGRRVEPRESAYVEQLPSHCADCGRLNHLREMVVVHTGLEEGCTVVLDYTLHRLNSNLYDHFDMMQRYPVRRYEVVVNGQTFREERNIPQDDWSATPYSVKPTNYEVTLLFGDLPQWESDRWITDTYGLYGIDTITRLEPMARAQAVCRWVRDNVVCHHGLDLSHLDYQIASSAVVYADNCGTPYECVNLAIALMNRVGIDATLTRDTTIADLAESFRADVIIDKIHYLVNPLSSAVWTPIGAAVEDRISIQIDSTLAFAPETLASGYSRITLPTVDGALDIDPALLTPSRTVPVKVKPCNESYCYTIPLPKKTKLVGKINPVEYRVDGIGSISVNVKQKGSKLIVTRQLTINCDEVDMVHYGDFRRMMQDWQRGRVLIVK